jgi:amino acid transporter
MAYIAIAATGMIYLSYFMCNLGVLVARRRGWPHKSEWFSLGSWGTILNILALVWGGVMIVNVALWTDPGLFGIYGSDLRNTWSNPFINTIVKWNGAVLDGLPAWPVFETLVLGAVVIGIVYYVVAQRGKLDREQVETDPATGEATIG